jgi:hypothetical protein
MRMKSYFGGIRKERKQARQSQQHPVLKRGGKVTTRKDIPALIPSTPSSTSPSSNTPGRPLGRLHSRSPQSHQWNHNFLNQAKRTLSRYKRFGKPTLPLSQEDRISLLLRNTQAAIANSQAAGQTQALPNPIWDSRVFLPTPSKVGLFANPRRSSKRGYELPLSVCRFF